MFRMVTPDSQPGMGCLIPLVFTWVLPSFHSFHCVTVNIPASSPEDAALPHPPRAQEIVQLRETLWEKEEVQKQDPLRLPPLPVDRPTSSLHFSPNGRTDFW